MIHKEAVRLRSYYKALDRAAYYLEQTMLATEEAALMAGDMPDQERLEQIAFSLMGYKEGLVSISQLTRIDYEALEKSNTTQPLSDTGIAAGSGKR